MALVNGGRTDAFCAMMGLFDRPLVLLTASVVGRGFGEGLKIGVMSSSSSISSTFVSDTRLRFGGESSSEISSTALFCPDGDGRVPFTPLAGDLEDMDAGRGAGCFDIPGGSSRA